MDLVSIIEWVIEGILIILVLLAGFAYLTLYERKALARIQVRIGPNRAGPWGILQPVADGVKLIFKEELIPARAYKFVFVLAPIITVIPMLVILAVVPLEKTHICLDAISHSILLISMWGSYTSYRSPRSRCMVSCLRVGHRTISTLCWEVYALLPR